MLRNKRVVDFKEFLSCVLNCSVDYLSGGIFFFWVILELEGRLSQVHLCVAECVSIAPEPK